MSQAPATPALRLVTVKNHPGLSSAPDDPYPYTLDALELVPGISSTPEQDCCLVVEYDDLEADQVQGDRFCLTLQEALAAAQEAFGIGRKDWVLPAGFDSIEAAYQAIVEAHVAAYGRPAPVMAGDSVSPATERS